MVYATNESSYKFGLKYGKEEWQCTADLSGDCTPVNGQGSCTNTWNGAAMGAVTNIMACLDGYVHAWNKVCDPTNFVVTHNPTIIICPTTRVFESAGNGWGAADYVHGTNKTMQIVGYLAPVTK